MGRIASEFDEVSGISCDPKVRRGRYPLEPVRLREEILDSWNDLAVDYCCSDAGPPRSGRLLLKLIIFYIVLAALCHTECLFRQHGIELEAKVETVGQVRTGGRHPRDCLLVRYHFSDPFTGKPRFNTVTIPKNHAPTGTTATIVYVAGEPPSTRLKIQERPFVIDLFFWVNVIFLAAIAVVIGRIAWEANHPIQRSSERRVPVLPPRHARSRSVSHPRANAR